MDYTEVNINTKNIPEFIPEILMAVLGELGFESFVENKHEVLAYISSDKFCKKDVEKMLSHYFVDYSFRDIKHENWNAKWEANYKPVVIEDRLIIKAPFHNIDKKYDIEVLIEPKMSFGTGHHETTYLMSKLILNSDWKDKSVLDMGTGTGVLAVLCSLLGAKDVYAIDIDEIIRENIQENIKNNKVENISFDIGDKTVIPNKIYDTILANINRNVLIADIPCYATKLISGGEMFLSGFYSEDLLLIKEVAQQNNLTLKEKVIMNNWIACIFVKD